MTLTPDEERLLELLQKKQTAASVTTSAGDGNVFQLIPGGKLNESPDVTYLRTFLRKVESGEVTQFVAVGLKADGINVDAAYSHQKASFAMLGALDVIRGY